LKSGHVHPDTPCLPHGNQQENNPKI